MGAWAKPRLAGLSRDRRVKLWARGLKRRFCKAGEDVVLHSSALDITRCLGCPSSELLLFITGGTKCKQDCKREKTVVFPHSW